MSGRSVVLAVLIVGLVSSSVAAGQPDAVGSLQGRWVVTAGEHNGVAMDSLNGGILTVDGTNFAIQTASGNQLVGMLEADASLQPAHLDLQHNDGTHWEAVFEVDGDTLRLNYVDANGADPRPTGFTTAPTNEESLVVLRRAEP